MIVLLVLLKMAILLPQYRKKGLLGKNTIKIFPIYTDIIHINDYGRQIIADSIHNEMKSFLINDF
jgi:hypothetical protein